MTYNKLVDYFIRLKGVMKEKFIEYVKVVLASACALFLFSAIMTMMRLFSDDAIVVIPLFGAPVVPAILWLIKYSNNYIKGA